MIKSPVYLDYHSTTPVDARVLEEMLPYFTTKFGNAASKTHSYGWIAEDAVKQARERVAHLINAEEEEIIFTSGATESINLALKGVYEIYKTKGNHIITVATEHRAVLDTCKSLEKNGAQITYLTVDREGMIDLQELKNAISDQTILISVMYANNETGVIQQIKKIAALASEKGIIMMSDATQAIGKIRVDVQEDGIDLLCLSGHKMYGPKGVGALYVRRKNPRVRLAAQIDGGGHERGFRSGTLNVPGIVGLGKACEIAEEEIWDDAMRTSKLRTRLEHGLIDGPGSIYVNGSQKYRLPNVTNLSFQGIKADALLMALKGIALSTGSACSSASMEPSHVLKAMGLTDELSFASIRFSLGKYTSEEEIVYTITKVSEAVLALRKDVVL